MLAYVFWHRRSPGIDDSSYADLLRRFHRVLAAHPTPGFLGSYSYRLSAAPWLPGHETAYEDWYLLENSAAIDPLNDGAVSCPVRPRRRLACRRRTRRSSWSKP